MSLPARGREYVNAARCLKCGEVLVSLYRHDFVSCVCGNHVDGGHDYLKRGAADLGDFDPAFDEVIAQINHAVEQRVKAESA